MKVKHSYLFVRGNICKFARKLIRICCYFLKIGDSLINENFWKYISYQRRHLTFISLFRKARNIIMYMSLVSKQRGNTIYDKLSRILALIYRTRCTHSRAFASLLMTFLWWWWWWWLPLLFYVKKHKFKFDQPVL